MGLNKASIWDWMPRLRFVYSSFHHIDPDLVIVFFLFVNKKKKCEIYSDNYMRRQTLNDLIPGATGPHCSLRKHIDKQLLHCFYNVHRKSWKTSTHPQLKVDWTKFKAACLMLAKDNHPHKIHLPSPCFAHFLVYSHTKAHVWTRNNMASRLARSHCMSLARVWS